MRRDRTTLQNFTAEPLLLPVPEEEQGNGRLLGAAMEQMAKLTRSEAKRVLQDRQRAWLQWVIKQTGKRPAQIGREAEVSDTPLTRLLNNPDYPGTLSELTVERITSQLGVPGPAEYLGPRKQPGADVPEREAELLGLDQLSDRAKNALGLLGEGRQGIESWKLLSSCLEGAGYFPGDLMLLDPHAQPNAGDAVCGIVRDGEPELVWRLYDPPFLVAQPGLGKAAKPLLVDGDRVKLRGVVIASLRPRKDPPAAS